MNTPENGAHVEELYLKENRLEQLPDKLHKKLPLLSNIYLHKNNMTQLPQDIGQMQRLTVLDLSKNHLTGVPESIKNLQCLKTLDLSHNHLTKLDENLFKIRSLEYLVAVSNRIKVLPESVSNLRNLFGLYLSKNIITSVPVDICKCCNLTELYLDHNQLSTIPNSICRMKSLSILSLSSNNLISLPALPFLSCARLLCEANPTLHFIPYLTGCQQTIISHSSQATWAAMAGPIVQNTLHGVWSMRLQGCATQQSVEDSDDSIFVKNKKLKLQSTLEQVTSTSSGCTASLTELCFKHVYSFLKDSLILSLKTSDDIHLHLPSLNSRTDGLPLSSCNLPTSLSKTLVQGPYSFCSRPTCSRPIFKEAVMEIIEKDVQRTFLGTGELEIIPILASRFYCSSACYTNFYLAQNFQWEHDLFKKSVDWEWIKS